MIKRTSVGCFVSSPSFRAFFQSPRHQLIAYPCTGRGELDEDLTAPLGRVGMTAIPTRGDEDWLVVESTHPKNMLLKLDHFPNDRDENKTYLKPPTRRPLKGVMFQLQ